MPILGTQRLGSKQTKQKNYSFAVLTKHISHKTSHHNFICKTFEIKIENKDRNCSMVTFRVQTILVVGTKGMLKFKLQQTILFTRQSDEMDRVVVLKTVFFCLSVICNVQVRLNLIVSNSQGRSITAARTYGLSSNQGDLGESGKGIFTSQSY